jgi:predicted dehydrogenase
MIGPLRVGLIGCGAIGRVRVGAIGDDELVAATDIDPAAAESLVADHGAGVAVLDAEAVLRTGPDVVVVATVHSALADLTCQALEAGAHVLVEKPAGISVADIDRVAATAARTGRLVKVGFNHRFHPGTAHAIELARSGRFGDIMFVRGRYGHGARPGYEREWRMDKSLSGGGELVDQGMHLIDLCHAVLGDLPLHSALLRNQFWTSEVEDNAALLLGDPADRSGPWAQLHVTWTEWKNMFSLEITCRTGKITVDGLARSYGAQVVHVYSMKPEMGPPDVQRIEYDAVDVSWQREWAHFREAILSGDVNPPLNGDLISARYAWAQVENAYAQEPAPSLVTR